MEVQATECLRKKDWSNAVELYNKLLMNKQVSKQQMVSYLLGRSECFLELSQHEAVVSDCRKIIKLLADRKEDDTGTRVRRRLVQALLSLQRFGEAEMVTREWLSLIGGPKENSETNRLLQHLHAAFQNASSKNQMDAALLALEAKFSNNFKEGGLTNEVSNVENVIKCVYCRISFNDKSELRAHCQSESHQMVIMSDEGRDWQWRPPPRGFNTDSYTLCESWTDTETCRFGGQCVEAHGLKELAEWKERFEYRKMKLQRAYEKELYGKSYTEELLEKWIQASSPETIMRERLSDVEDICTDTLSTTVSSKNSMHEWTFILKTNKILQAVALLQDSHRNHFFLQEIVCTCEKGTSIRADITNNQEWTSRQNIFSSKTVLEYTIKVMFKTDIFGTFRQSLVFDFGSLPILVKHLCVDVIPVMDMEKINEIRKEIVLSSAERWCCNNSDVVPFTSSLSPLDDDWGKKLKTIYPSPQAETFTLSHATVTEKKLTKNNYRSRMHELLYVEEMARYELVSKYNLTAKLRIAHSYLLSPSGMANTTAKYSNSGELFALMHLSKDLSEDTSEGRLILNNCHMVLIMADKGNDNQGKRRVYEALIEDKGKKMIYLRLSAKTVEELKLTSDSEFKAQIQFQLNRVPYCEWHYGIDKIADFKLIFPDTYLEPSIPWSPQRQWSDTLDTRLNLKQKEAVVAITTPLYIPLPPILIIGPFGTGKTFTLAQAIKEIVQQPNTRILICTHSNSAADLYIKDYLHPYVEEGHEEARPLRIYYHKRWVATVNPIVQKYCLIDTSGSSRNFRVPSIEDITKHKVVVVTLSISIYLSTLGLPPGFFTHILLDEAAQAMECETIMPLAFANESTRIVLAGDHMQLSPDLFSQFAKERNLHVSLLERLYDHYPSTFPCKVLLCENYRAHEAIIQFTSESFYDQKLISSGKQPRHNVYYPLTFFTTRGEDVQDQNSTAFYNNSEVYEVVERVAELKKMWPASWGKIDDQSIGIMTPYSDQVFRIRSELRKRCMGGISVERVLNVQGKQFRAIFLSTVRTRRTCTGGKLIDDDVDYGFLSNSKLLNTAITRAQSLVAVVGDPIALCSIGRCSKVWERFLQICNSNKSLYGITWSLLRSQLDGVEMKKTYSLNPLAPEFIPRKYQREAYIRCLPMMPYNMGINNNLPPPPPPPIHGPTNIPINRHPVLSPYAVVPMDPNVLSMICRIPQSPNLYFSRLPQIYHPWPHNNIVSPPPNGLKQDMPATKSINPRELNISQLPPTNSGLMNSYKTSVPPGPFIHNNHVDSRPAVHLPDEMAGYKRCSEFPNIQIQKPQELIQFLNNVHFPEAPKEQCTQPVGQTLNDYINLLPHNMSLADVLFQPHNFQERWFYHLLETRGIEAAKKFEYLIHTTTKKEMSNHQMPSVSSNNPVGIGSLFNVQEIPNFNWFDKPVNQINFNKPVYLKDSENPIPIAACNIKNNGILQPNLKPVGNINLIPEQPHALPPKESQPLYKRHINPECSRERFPVARNVEHNHFLPATIGHNSSNGLVEERLSQQQHWQQQINEDFANLSINNSESIDDMINSFSKGVTYASVLRAPQRPCIEQQQKFNNNLSVLNNLEHNANNLNSPRLYQYFS